MDCLFCNIIDNKIEAKKIFEDEKVIVILDAFPFCEGHTLIIPKKHYTDIYELPLEELNHIMGIAKAIALEGMKKLNKKGVTLSINYGNEQQIKHFHLHILYDLKEKRKEKSVDEIFELLK